MKTLLEKIDEKATVRLVEQHLFALNKIRHLYTTVDVEEADILPQRKNRNVLGSEDKMLRIVNKTDYVNRVTMAYLERMLNALNALDAYDRKLLFGKYYYEMDDEELSEEVGYSSRKIWNDLKQAKINLAFLLGCEQYSE